MLCSKRTASSTGAILSFFYSIVIIIWLSMFFRCSISHPIIGHFARGRSPTMVKVLLNFPHLLPHAILSILIDGTLNLLCWGDKLISLQDNSFAGWIAAAAAATAIIAAATASTATTTITTWIGTLGARAWVWVWVRTWVAIGSRSSCWSQFTVLTLRWRFAATTRVRTTVTASKERGKLLYIAHF